MPADAGATLSLDQAVRAMIEFSDNAATDYLLARLGRERVLETAGLLDVEAFGAGVAPIVGALLTVADDALGDSVDERISRLRSLTVDQRAGHAWRLAARYAEAPEAALAGLAPALQGLSDWGKQLALAGALPWRGSARDLAAVVEEAVRGKALGPEAAGVMARHLSWPLAEPGLAARFEVARAQGGRDGRRAGARRLRAATQRAVEGRGAGRRPPARGYGRRRVAGGRGTRCLCLQPTSPTRLSRRNTSGKG